MVRRKYTNQEELKSALREGGAKGGRARVPKGFAKMSPEKLKEISRRSAEARRARKHEA